MLIGVWVLGPGGWVLGVLDLGSFGSWWDGIGGIWVRSSELEVLGGVLSFKAF